MRHTVKAGGVNEGRGERKTGILFDLDGTLIDSVYQHVLAWREALESVGIDIPVWKIQQKRGLLPATFCAIVLTTESIRVKLRRTPTDVGTHRRMVMRGKGEGSIYESQGRWVAQVESGRYSSGRRKYARTFHRTRKEAVASLRELTRQAEAGVAGDRRLTVEAFAATWLDHTLPTTGIRESTIEGYRKMFRLYINPHVGAVKLHELRPRHVEQMLTALADKGHALHTRQQARGLLVQLLKRAQREELVIRNVAELAAGPKGVARKIDPLDADGARAVIAAAADHRHGALAIVALRLGLRQGEALALRWEHIDLEAGELTVAGTLKRRSAGGVYRAGEPALYVDTPKTAAGRRTVPLVNGTLDALKRRRRVQLEERAAAGPLWRDSGFVFTTKRGTPLDPVEARRLWHEWTEAAGLGKIRFHASRHTCATLLLEDGTPLEVVSAVLGHASLSITADVYGSIGMDAKRAALARLDTGS
jgi:integrase